MEEGARLVVAASAFVLLGVPSAVAQQPSRAARVDDRVRMVQQQIEGRGVEDQEVLGAMLAVPRHEFVPERHRDMAYANQPLPIGEGQTINQPYIVALMTELPELDPGDKVL